MTRSGVFGAMSEEYYGRLTALAHEVSFPVGERIFEEGGDADRFWIVRTGTVALDLRIPGRRAAVVETVGPGELLGWSWLIPPRRWHLGAEASTPVRAHAFDAAEVRALCAKDPGLDHAVSTHAAAVVARRLRASRTRLLDLLTEHGGPGGMPRWVVP
ncbi:cyclic nucleotide-binding domain-containing protein [Streptomyces sp. LX-29]|uniref:Crp/Fnr family transcriptional regulator n=1 Tax=Streptomyces sp. LX-29 TaxID=2900152 RepID=UPI00240DC299|nr:cyclic nucleotide-binding domain-containing protein [Streptomyces sp. LX-29]WFB11432.1 cyclic nucleotide-binding domain-containing protein [Streptomyces sp. LX-29]